MNKRLQAILNLIQISGSLTPEEKKSLADAVKESDKEITITEFKLERTEKVKRTTAILLEETIAELEQKRKSVEAQNRELEIEGALERVRSRSMEMNGSNELRDVIQVVFEQLLHLDFEIDSASFSLNYKESDDFNLWTARPGQPYPTLFHIPYLDHPIFNKVKEAKEKGLDFFSDRYTKEEKDIFFIHFFTHAPHVPRERQEFILSSAGWARSQVLMETISLFIQNYQGKEYSSEENDILKRFGKVFEQAYTRFLDLQKAEAQAREAKIETALERVRSKTMAMHHSEELKEVISVTFEQLKSLNIIIDSCIITLFIDGSDDLNNWVTSAEQKYPQRVRVPYFKHPLFDNIALAKKKPGGHFTLKLSKEENQRFYNHILENSEFGKIINEDRKKLVMNADSNIMSFANFKHTGLRIGNFHNYTYTHEENNTIHRFANVFEQTYTRFLDLQKAEAQAREAQIEAALERVRSRTMAMQHSDELLDVASILFQQVKALGVPQWNCGFNIWEIGDKEFTYYPGSPDGIILPSPCKIPLTEHPVFISFDESRKRGDELFVYEKAGEYQAGHYRYMLSLPGVGDLLQSMLDAGFQLPTFQIDHIVNFSRGNLIFITYEHFPEMHDIFKRFGKVFEQTYARFLDLQKAEAQAREAQTEAALERVRSRTMAMQHSSELAEISFLLVKQVLGLGIKTWGCAFNIFDEDQPSSTEWFSNEQGYKSIYKTPREGVFLRYYEAAQKGESLHVEEFRDDACIEHYRYLSTLPGLDDEMKFYAEHGVPLPTSQFDNVTYFKYGYLLFVTYEDVPEAHDTFKRFAKVFEQTYTRFLDLQKAEAQAREAKIEVSLERVRSKAMAMHKSEDLTAAVAVVFDELEKLELGMSRCGIGILNKENRSSDVWTTSKSEGKNTVHVSGDESMDIHPLLQKAFDAWLKQEDLTYILQGEDLADYYRALQHTNFRLPESEAMVTNAATLQQHYYVATFPAGALFAFRENLFTDEAKNVMKRFANVFNLTYKRFQDIQKAEAQAREAQIEAALEKVRSRSLAMHKSDEVAFVVDELFLRLKDLEIGFDSVNILEFTEDAFQIWAAYQPGKFTVTKIPFSKSDIPYVRSAVEAKSKGLKLYTHQYLFEEKNLFLNYLFDETHFKNLPDERKQFLLQCPCYTVSIGFAKNTAIQLQSYSRAAFSEIENNILKRFVNVFEQAYTRFLDLQTVEGQAREAQIQLALERVRARTMAMQHSNELRDAASVLFQQVKELGIDAWTCGFSIWDEDRKAPTAWLSRGVMQPPFKTPLTENQTLMHFYEAAQRGETLFVEEVSGETLTELYRYLGTLLVAEGVSDEIRKPGYAPPTFQVNHVAYFSYGYLLFITYKQYPEAHDIFKRFAKVFEQTYTRFLDLQRAEAQARESQIEASLERVRSKTMAMHSSQDVGDTVATVFDELLKLNIKTNRCGILIFSNSTDAEVWTAKSTTSGKANLIIGHLDVTRHLMLTNARNWWKSKAALFSYELIGDDLINYYQMINNQPDYPIQINMESLPSKEIHTEFYFPEGAVFAFTSEPIAADESQIFKRLASVFGQTYRRYLDLQKAEAQAREAQIETALERVRSRTMAMHRSEEIADIVGKIFKELTSLHVALNRVLIWIFNSDEKYFTWWSANPEAESNAESYRVNYVDHPVFSTYFDAWQKKLPLLLYTLGDDLKVSWDDHLFKNTELSRLPKAVQDGMRSEKKIFTTSAIGEYGLLMAGCFEPFADEVNDIIQRFGRVFQQSYTRYVDVQKAEAQARDATIEASLEKVRGKAMAMHNSNDLVSTASLVFTELRKLGINSFRSGVGLLNKESSKAKLYSATTSAEGDNLSLVGWAALEGHAVLSEIYNSWLVSKDYFPVLKGELLKTYYEKLNSNFMVPPAQSTGYEQHGYFLTFSEGVFYGWSEKPYTEAEIKILHRFKGILDLTFRRYIELQKSEASAIEAIRQASLDRVRAEIASMRTTNDLDRITPLIWKELNILDIPFVRCGVFIMDEFQHQIHTFLSTPEGKAIAAFNLPYDATGNVGEILTHWLDKKMYISHWDESAFSELGEQLVQQGAIPSKEVYMSTVPPGGIHLHCVPFLQGMLYVGNTAQLHESDIHLIQSVADAFSTAYARYEDFNKLESAKAQIEKTLTDLKVTQNQLVQSEKMASLGELTAGIAHEIQNPLNFVNNFSEVSNELLEEMKEEIQKGNYEEVQTITDSVKQNLEKILHHGKRADGIVKGMLQHSRSSTGVKEPTDINALVDEYLRLAYHGFRAKDKSFNASTNTDLDKSIGNINIVPQDIGRVVLNLITNAFYAVTEKQKHTTAEYQPAVSLSTKRQDDCVLISVKDNGNGIPEQIREKIFQPFFTTKPTGQGTGLGLSLSYDIVKAHGGDLKMETKEGKGSEFVISIMDK